VLGGVGSTLAERLIQAGGAIPPSLETGYVVPFDPETFKSVAFDLLDEADVEYLLNGLAANVVYEDSTPGVVFATQSGPMTLCGPPTPVMSTCLARTFCSSDLRAMPTSIATGQAAGVCGAREEFWSP
jgi:hypothetical protein